jgi:hypothetical protein
MVAESGQKGDERERRGRERQKIRRTREVLACSFVVSRRITRLAWLESTQATLGMYVPVNPSALLLARTPPTPSHPATDS